MKTTILIILAFAAVNGLAAFLIYAHSRRPLYLRTGLFWSALIVNFLIQGQAQGSEFLIIMCYGFTIVPLHLLAYASLSFCDARYPARIFIPLSLLALGLTLALAGTDLSFTARAMPFAVAAALPLLHAVYCFVRVPRRGLTPLMGAHAFVLILLAVHSINFALFRMQPAAQLWGWPIAYGLYQILAMLFPALTADFSHLEEKERLNRIIEARTGELLGANRRLERLVQQKDFLSKTLTHDISNPLSVIQGRLALAKRGIKDEAKLVNDLTQMAGRIENLIKQVRDFASVEQRIAARALDEVQVGAAVADMRQLFDERLRAKNLNLIFAGDHDGIIRVEQDSFLSSVLPNLISNAIKFSHPGATIRVSVAPRGEGKVGVAVEDGGTGIPHELIERLFTFGRNTSRAGTAGEAGTGFGLPILAQLIEAYGGRIDVESETETGERSGWTRFTMTFDGRLQDFSRAA